MESMTFRCRVGASNSIDLSKPGVYRQLDPIHRRGGSAQVLDRGSNVRPTQRPQCQPRSLFLCPLSSNPIVQMGDTVALEDPGALELDVLGI